MRALRGLPTISGCHVAATFQRDGILAGELQRRGRARRLEEEDGLALAPVDLVLVELRRLEIDGRPLREQRPSFFRRSLLQGHDDDEPAH